jgi:cytochrome bd-type quinol oxidase subunit 1
MEFQFGTNWSVFSRSTGAVIGQTLAMEGVFSFFLESTFLGAFLYGEKQLGQRLHWLAAFLVFLGSWISRHDFGSSIGRKKSLNLRSAPISNPRNRRRDG